MALRTWSLAVVLLLAAPVRAEEPVRAVIGPDRAVIACFVGEQQVDAAACPPGPAVVSQYAAIRPGRIDIAEHDGMLRRGLPLGLEGASLDACGMMVADEAPADAPGRAVGSVSIVPLAPAPLAAAVAEALRLRGTQVEKGFDITGDGVTRRFFLASDEAEALAYAQANPGAEANYHLLAGFLRTNRDGRPVADMLFVKIATMIEGTDALPRYDLVGVTLVKGRLAFAVLSGYGPMTGVTLVDADGWRLGAMPPPRCL